MHFLSDDTRIPCKQPATTPIAHLLPLAGHLHRQLAAVALAKQVHINAPELRSGRIESAHQLHQIRRALGVRAAERVRRLRPTESGPDRGIDEQHVQVAHPSVRATRAVHRQRADLLEVAVAGCRGARTALQPNGERPFRRLAVGQWIGGEVQPPEEVGAVADAHVTPVLAAVSGGAVIWLVAKTRWIG